MTNGKNKLHNKMADHWLHPCFLSCIESQLFQLIYNDVIVEGSQNMKLVEANGMIIN